MVSAKVFYDKERLSLEAEPSAAERISSSTKLIFEFKPVQTNFGIDEQNPDTIPDKLRYNWLITFIVEIIKFVKNL